MMNATSDRKLGVEDSMASSTVDFDRPVYMLMGLPVDAVTATQATEMVRQSVASGRRCFLSTPNLNFSMAAISDAEFRDSVIDSDLVLADGMPLVWAASILGIPIPERVAGSSVAAQLQREFTKGDRQIRVYFFGGLPGVAEKACQELAKQPSGLIGVGSHNPGFGTVEAMSSEKLIADVNAAQPDLVLVSLGAKKGQAWIQANRAAIQAPVIAHLGAVVNFIAGTVKRAPVWVQRVGLEWVWRIWEEHALFKRYWRDGWGYVRELLTHVLPLRRELNVWRRKLTDLPGLQVQVTAASPKLSIVRMQGCASGSGVDAARQCFKELASAKAADIEIDLRDCVYVDAAFLGLLALLLKHQRIKGKSLRLSGASATLGKLIRLHGANYLLA